MNYAALSTDIKKSSVNWALNSEWMEKAVSYHNAIVEKIVGQPDYEDINPNLLPNCPEGDAYTYFFKYEDMKVLREHVINIGLQIQATLNDQRNTKSPLTIKDYGDKPEFRGKIFIRIGIAFSQEAPFTYYFCRYRPEGRSDCTNDFRTRNKSKSYRGTVIDMSELAEQKADYKYMPAMKNDSNQCEMRCQEYPSITECFMDGDEFKFRRIVQHCAVPFFEDGFTGVKTESKDVTGFCIFVEYKRAILDDLVKTNPYIRKFIADEYTSIHYEANAAVITWLNNHEQYEGGLVKEKRNSSSMYVIKRTGQSNKTEPKDIVSLYETMLILLSDLPFGSCIGIAFGEMKEKTVTRKNNTYYDYFQTTVNNAARMAMVDFSYASKWGYRVNNHHVNRLAFTGGTSTIDNTSVIEKLVEKDIFFSVDKVPLKSINAGEGTITCISSASKGWETLREGDKVKVRGMGEGVNKISSITDNGKFRVGGKTKKRSQLIKL